MSKTFVQFTVKVLVLALLLVLTLMAAKGAFGAVTKKPHDNSIGVIMQQDNPLTYTEGVMTNFAAVGPGVNVRIQPRGVYQLYTQEILFCDVEEFATALGNKRGVVVLSYNRVAHRTIEGIGCHDILLIDEVTK